MQLEQEFKLGYNGAKMTPETKTSQSSFVSGSLLATFAKSALLPSSHVKSAFCEPGNSITPLLHIGGPEELFGVNDDPAPFSWATSTMENNPITKSKNILTGILSNCFAHGTCSPELKRYSIDSLNNNNWLKRLTEQQLIVDRTNSINIVQHSSMFSSKIPMTSIINVKCMEEMDSSSQRHPVMELEAPKSSPCLPLCVSLSDPEMDILSESCSVEGGGAEPVVESTGGAYLCSISERVTDICQNGAPSEFKTSGSASDHLCVEKELADYASSHSCDRQERVVLPKTMCVCSNRKKKTRPSSKKRNRRKRQCCVEDHVVASSMEGELPGEFTRESDTSDDSDVLSFVIDFTGGMDLNENRFSTSQRAASSPTLDRLSLFISAGDVFDTDDSDIEDFIKFCDDEVDLGMSGTSSFLMSPLSSSESFHTEFDCLSPLMLRIPGNQSSLPSDELFESRLDSDDESVFVDLEMKKLLDEANNKWEESYGHIHIDQISGPSKVGIIMNIELLDIFQSKN